MKHIQRLALLAAVAGLLTASSALAATHGTAFTVHSTLDGRTVLPIRIHWIAKPSIASSKVSKVDYLIDGRLAWVEHRAPYVYANDGNWLVTSFLRPGRHVFSVRAISTSGQKTSDSVTARVIPAPSPPADLAGTWSRTATVTDLKKCTSQNASGCPPTGTWRITISSKGWSPDDPQGNVGLFDVVYLSATHLQVRPTIEYPLYPNSNNGGWCDDTDPLATYTVAIDPGGSTMTLVPLGHDPCPNRAAILEGTWTHSST
jgi:hypothetical protein